MFSDKKVLKKEYKLLKNQYYSLKERTISLIKNGYCIIPEKNLKRLSEQYKQKYVQLLNKGLPTDEFKEEYKLIAEEYYIRNLSNELNENIFKEVNNLENILEIYESNFKKNKFSDYFEKIIGKTPLSKAITLAQIATGLICLFDNSGIPRNLTEIALMQYSKYQLDSNKKKRIKNTLEDKIIALKSGINYLSNYFLKKEIITV